jgi:4-amino-4-deoxy-L-arabinose transferase-like glycosyltransferase
MTISAHVGDRADSAASETRRSESSSLWGRTERQAPVLGVLFALIYQALASLRLGNASAFVDEATYIVAGRRMLESWRQGTPLPPFASYFSGSPVLYPPLAAMADGLGGLEGARLVSLVCMLAATVVVWRLGKVLVGRTAGSWSAITFAVQAPVLFVGRIATYDALSLLLLSLAVLCAVETLRESDPRGKWSRALAAGTLLGLACATKYAALLFVPSVLALLAISASPEGRWREARTSLMLAIAGALFIALGVLFVGGLAQIDGLRATTLQRSPVRVTNVGELLQLVRSLAGSYLVLALGGLLLISRRRSRDATSARVRRIAIILLLTALLVPLQHLRIGESVSLHKHLAYSALFAAPLVGAACASLVALVRRLLTAHEWIAGAALAGLALVLFARWIVMPGQREAGVLMTYWPKESAPVYRSLQALVGPQSRMLDEEPDLGAYYLAPHTSPDQWTSSYYFVYGSPTAQKLSGDAAYVAAIRDGFFDLIIYRNGPRPEWVRTIEAELSRQSVYHRSAQRSFSLASGPAHYTIWRRDPR